MLDEDFILNNAYCIWTSNDGSMFYDFLVVKESKKIFDKVEIIFRDNKLNIYLPHNKFIYFSFGAGKEMTEENEATDAFFVIGYQDSDNRIKKMWYKTPELLLKNTTYQDTDKCNSKCLYFNG